MKLTMKPEKQDMKFIAPDGKVFYTLTAKHEPVQGSAKVRASLVVKEFINIKEVRNAETKSRAGWSWSVAQKINYRIEQLKTELMGVCANEYLHLFGEGSLD